MRWWRLRLIRPVDAAIAAGFWAVGAVTTDGVGIEQPAFTFAPRDLTFWVLLTAATVPYAVRRAQPTVVFATTLTAVTLLWSLSYDAGALPLVLLVGGYWVAETRPPREVLVAGAAAAAAVTWLSWAHGAPFATREWVSSVVTQAGVMALGHAAQERAALVQARAVATEEAARRRAGEERLRVSGELHDIVGHSLGIIAIQAGVGHHLMATDPERAAAALDTIARLSRESLDEVRAVIADLRDGELNRQPTAELTDLARLADTVRLSGLDVRLTLPDAVHSVPPRVAAAIYRISQEALTNTVRHARATTAWVHVHQPPGRVELTIDDDGSSPGSPADPAAPRDGQGIRGMRDRAHALGGTLTADRSPRGGFRVHASLPTDAS
ncbi:MAG: sensor histidine kinase [Nocardioidaceae bacterium]|nr:sensor histidine kinase [Nocardioidaceae bacterium]